MRTARFFLFACAIVTAEGNAPAQEYEEETVSRKIVTNLKN
jgi:hypothetical protein